MSEGWLNLGVAIQRFRTHKKIRQNGLALRLGISPSQVSRIESTGKLNIVMLRKIAKAFRVEAWAIVAKAEALDAEDSLGPTDR